MAQAPLCVPPEEPWMPENDADLRAYVDLLAADFERYFSALTSRAKTADPINISEGVFILSTYRER